VLLPLRLLLLLQSSSLISDVVLSLPPSPQSAAAGARFLHILHNSIRVWCSCCCVHMGAMTIQARGAGLHCHIPDTSWCSSSDLMERIMCFSWRRLRV
jgi:hypothetical protein